MKFRKKPVVIEAIQWTGTNLAEVRAFGADTMAIRDVPVPGDANDPTGTEGPIVIATLEGLMLARVGDWIIRGVKGEFYPDIFAATYEPAEV